MYQLTHLVLEAETELPMEIAGWGMLVLGVLITVGWLVYLYR